MKMGMLENDFEKHHEEDERDLFFRCDQVFEDEDAAKEILRPLFLHKSRYPGLMRSRLAILASALAYTRGGRFLSYPCNHNRYKGMTRYNGPAYNQDNVPEEVIKLTRKGLLDHDHRLPMSHMDDDPRQSSFRGKPKLFELMGHLKLRWVLHEPIRKKGMFLKGTETQCFSKERFRTYEKRLVGYEDTDFTRTLRAEIVRINDFLSTVRLRWPGLEGRVVGHNNVFDADGVLTTPLYLTRIFSRNDFKLYGRCHGFWQNARKDLRKLILLNDEETCEPDYSQCHCNIAYLEKGLIPPENAYDVDGYTRNQVKPILPILFNAGDFESAVHAVSTRKKAPMSEEDAAVLIEKVKQAHQPVSDYFHQDKGLELMNIESDIVVRVMLKLVDEGIPFLPVHDSLRCPLSQRERVKEVMVESFKERYPDYTCHVKG